MDVSILIKQRLAHLELDQKDLAAAAQVTESYISQLLGRKKAPPAPGRTDIYEKMGQFLKLPAGELSRMAELQRQAEMRKKVTAPAVPLFKDCRQLILRKCTAARRAEVGFLFAKEPFGELERLVTQTILEVALGVAREELRNEGWLRSMAKPAGRTHAETRVAILEFLDTDIFHISMENCVAFLDPVIVSWDIDLKTFGLDVMTKSGGARRFEFIEKQDQQAREKERGLEQFLKDKSLSGDATEEEIAFLRSLTFNGRRPTALYYYRELQNLRDPLHFRPAT